MAQINRSRELEMENYLTIPETAETLGLSVLAVRKLVERRKLPFRKLGKRVLVPQQELIKFMHTLPGVSLETAARGK